MNSLYSITCSSFILPKCNYFSTIPEHINTCVPLGTFHCKEEVVLSVREWLRMHEPNLFHNGILILMLRWDKYINVSGDCAEK